nr:hypothetical protein [Tanacetum cinerariifolium]
MVMMALAVGGDDVDGGVVMKVGIEACGSRDGEDGVGGCCYISEVKKFCDGTLVKIREHLIDMAKKNKVGNDNKMLKGRDWTDNDVMKSNEMVRNVDQTLKRRE